MDDETRPAGGRTVHLTATDGIQMSDQVGGEIQHPDRRIAASLFAALIVLIVVPPFLVLFADGWPKPLAIAIGLLLNVVASVVGYKAIEKRLTITRF